MNKVTKLIFKNNYPELNAIIWVGGEKKPKGQFLSWIKSSDAVNILSRIAAALYGQSAEFFPHNEQREARAYFVSQLMEDQLKKLGTMTLDNTSVLMKFSNTTPKFSLSVCVGTNSEVEEFDKKHFHYSKPKKSSFSGHCYPKSNSNRDRTNLFVAVKTARNEDREAFPVYKLVSIIAHEMIHAVDQIGGRHSDMDFRSRRILFRHLYAEVLEKLGAHIEG